MTLLDFGSTLSEMHRRLFQRLFIHSHTERDLNVKIDRIISIDTVFDVRDEDLHVTVGQMGEFELFFSDYRQLLIHYMIHGIY